MILRKICKCHYMVVNINLAIVTIVAVIIIIIIIIINNFEEKVIGVYAWISTSSLWPPSDFSKFRRGETLSVMLTW